MSDQRPVDVPGSGKISLVMTVIGPDRPGLVEALSRAVVRPGGDWLESRMVHLAGQFAGVLLTTVPAAHADDLIASLRSLERDGLRVEVHRSAGGSVGSSPGSSPGEGVRSVELELFGPDHPGIIHDLARCLAARGVNVDELETERVAAPMTGDAIFRAWARLSVPVRIGADELHAALDAVAAETRVDIVLTASGAEGDAGS